MPAKYLMNKYSINPVGISLQKSSVHVLVFKPQLLYPPKK